MSYYKFDGLNNQKEIEKYIKDNGFLSRLEELDMAYASGDNPGMIMIERYFGAVHGNPVKDNGLVFKTSIMKINGNALRKKDISSLLRFDETLLKKELVYSTDIAPEEYTFFHCTDFVNDTRLNYHLITIPLTQKKEAEELIRLLHETEMRLRGNSYFKDLLKRGPNYPSKSTKKELRKIMGSLDARKYQRIF